MPSLKEPLKMYMSKNEIDPSRKIQGPRITNKHPPKKVDLSMISNKHS